MRARGSRRAAPRTSPRAASPHSRQASASSSSPTSSASPCAMACAAKLDATDRSAHRSGPPRPVLGGRVAPDAGAGHDAGGVEPGLADPGQQAAPGVGLGTVGLRDLVVEREPLVQAGRLRVPGHAGVVGVPDRDDAAGPRDPVHLPQRGDGVGEVLEDLVGVHDVERVVLERELVGVGDLERHVRRAGVRGSLLGDLDDGGRRVHADDRPTGASRAARSIVTDPGPQPTSSSRESGTRAASRYAAEFSAVRQRCERSTDSWCPCV